MQEIVSTIGGSLVAFMTSLVQALKGGFTEFFYDGTGVDRVISDIGIFMLVFIGVFMAVGGAKLIFHLIRNR